MLELIFSLILIVFCTVSGINLLISSSDMLSYDPMGAVTWPLILCVLLIVLLSVNLWKILRKSGGLKAVFIKKYDAKQLLASKFASGMMIMLLYGILLERIGFLFSTPLFIFAYMTVLGQRRVQVKVSTAAAATIVLYLLFNILLQVPLPRGYGIFRSMALTVESIL